MVLTKIYILSFLDFVSFALLITTFDQHILSLGGSHFFTGLIGSMHALLQLLSNPVFGGLTDTKGRKPVLLRALLFVLLYNCILTITNSFLVIFLARIILGVASQTQIILKILVADNVPPENRAGVFGKVGALAGLGFIVGPVLGGHLLELQNGFFYVTCAMMTNTLLSIGLTFLLPDTPIKNKSDETKDMGVLGSVVNELRKTSSNLRNVDWKIFWDLFALRLLVELSFSLLYSSFAMILLKVFLVSQKTLGYSLAGHSIFVILSNLVIGPIKKNFYGDDSTGTRRILHGFIILTFASCGLIVSSNFYMFLVFLIPVAITRAFMESTWTEVLLFRCGEKESGVIVGAFESIMPLSGFVTPLVSGIAIEYAGYKAPTTLSLIPAALGAILAVTLSRSRPKTKESTKQN